jgi:electron transport complex protein RnfG
MMVTLGIAGLCSGLAIVGIYLITQPMIERNRAEALEAAIFRVLEGAKTRAAFVLREGKLTLFESPNNSLPKEEAVYAGYDDAGALVGFAVPAEGPGYQDTIKLLYGYSAARRRVVGMEVLESRETPGLGDKIIKDMNFVGAFRDLAVEPRIVAVKGGRSAENEVDAISGATISSVAVCNIINEANSRWRERLDEAGSSAAAGNGSSPDAAASGGAGSGGTE